MSESVPTQPPATTNPFAHWLRRLLPLTILAVSLAGGYFLMKTPPKAKSVRSERTGTLVEVQAVEFRTEPIQVEAMGTVQPAQTIELLPRVGGEIQWVADDFVPGGTFSQGDKLLQIDPVDYELAKRAADKLVTEASTALQIEEGAQSVAREDFQLLGEVIGDDNRDLVLRKPQLEIAQANLSAARAELERAEIDLARTTVRAPFNAIIEGRPLTIGARVTPTSNLATLIGTDAYWIQATVPVNDIKWIQFPSPDAPTGSTVRIYDDAAWNPGASRTGTVKRLAASLETKGRMAQVIIEVKDPLALQQPNLPRLLIGSFVRVEFDGQELPDVAHLSRQLVKENDQVWILTKENTLEIRPVTVALRTRDHVIVSKGLRPGDQIVTTDLSAPVASMPLRTEAPAPSPSNTP